MGLETGPTLGNVISCSGRGGWFETTLHPDWPGTGDLRFLKRKNGDSILVSIINPGVEIRLNYIDAIRDFVMNKGIILPKNSSSSAGWQSFPHPLHPLYWLLSFPASEAGHKDGGTPRPPGDLWTSSDQCRHTSRTPTTHTPHPSWRKHHSNRRLTFTSYPSEWMRLCPWEKSVFSII